MLPFLVVALLLVLAGTVALLASRHAGSDPAPAAALGAPGRLAVRVTEGVGRTALAVDVLVDRRASEEVLRHRDTDPEAHRGDLVVVGAGLLGLGVVTALGAVLLHAG